jgi:hypothetical protein
VKRDGDKVTMHVDEYRFFITRLVELEAESAGLRKTLDSERASFDELASAMKAANQARLAERRAVSRRRWAPGLILGGGLTSGGKAEGVIGVGWKLEL